MEPQDRIEMPIYVTDEHGNKRQVDSLVFVRERTCRNTQNDFDFMCSECGKCVDNGRAIGINYCPKCGRKVEA